MMQAPMKCRIPRSLHLLPLLGLAMALVSCNTNLHIPLVGGDKAEAAPSEPDPDVPFTVNDKLSYGHTLKFTVYEGVRDTHKVFSGSAMVNRNGMLHIPKMGDANVGGLTPLEAVSRIETKFRANGKYEEGVLHVHLEQIEHTKLVLVTGAVHHPSVVQYFDGMTATSTLPYVGGREANIPAKALSVMRKGVSRTYMDPAANDPHLEPGDVVTFSGEL